MAKIKRDILLIEPGYKNKYPPIGLMKIATYHRMLGDKVTFYKGDVKELELSSAVEDCLKSISKINGDITTKEISSQVKDYIKTGHSTKLKKLITILEIDDILQNSLLQVELIHFAENYKNGISDKKWDRIYVTTLFTFYWKITIKAIHDSKRLVKDLKDLKVGGVLASLLTSELEDETGIKSIAGILDKPGMLDPNIEDAKDLVIDDLPLDYSILDEIDYKYPTGSAYFTFMTKGCTRTCAFCSVPKLEPVYKEKIPTKAKFEKIKELYGEQQNLLLMDNNVLASPKFPEIIQEIKEMGFVKGAKFIEANQLNIAITNLRKGQNDIANLKRCYLILKSFIQKRVKGQNIETVQEIYNRYELNKFETIKKHNLLAAYEELKELYERFRNKTPRNRYVDFNQGTDARYVTDEYMKLLSEIPINPLRIAFDYWGIRKQYENAVRLAAKYNINRLSNYLLFNFKDRPEDLYKRMQINMELSEELSIHIYSFPMKYIPLFGEEAKGRQHIGKFWNKKFIRAIQSVSNVTRGIVPPERTFFERAYGASVEEYIELLYMPETFIVYRKLFDEELGVTSKWRDLFRLIRNDEQLWNEARPILEASDFNNLEELTDNKYLLGFFSFYLISHKDAQNSDDEYLLLKTKFDNLINSDQFIDLTLTYDYEDRSQNLAANP